MYWTLSYVNENVVLDEDKQSIDMYKIKRQDNFLFSIFLVYLYN